MVDIHRVADEKLFEQLDGVGLLSACGLDEAECEVRGEGERNGGYRGGITQKVIFSEPRKLTVEGLPNFGSG